MAKIKTEIGQAEVKLKGVQADLVKMEKQKLTQDELKRQYDILQKNVVQAMGELKVNEVIVPAEEDGGKVLSGLIYDKIDIKYDEDKLLESLGKTRFNQVSDRILVADQGKLKEFLKQHPEFRDEMKEMITANSSLNVKKLDLAFEHGIFTLQDIQGCYEKKVTKVFKLQRKKEKGEA